MATVESSTEFKYIKVPTKDTDKVNEKEEIVSSYGYGIRHVQLVIFFLCLAMSFMARGHLGVTLVAMTSTQNYTHVEETYSKENITNYNDTTAAIKYLEESLKQLDSNHLTSHNTADTNGLNDIGESWSIYRKYDWPKPIQEMVLTSFFLGYFLMMFPIALVCQRWGGKVPLQMSMLINGVVSILTPWLALWGGWKAMCVCRVLQGLSQAGTYPGIQTLLAQWVPTSERATLSSYVYTGTTVGNIIGFQMGGLISDAWGWPVAFWSIGLLCLMTCAFLTVFGASSPTVHKKISEKEKSYIMGHADTGAIQRRRAPWKAIMTSKHVWGNFATHIGSGVSFIFFLTQVPSYIHYILGINVKSSGLLSSLPYLASFFSSLIFGNISDYLTNNKMISLRNARRISNTVSQVGVAATMVCTSFASSTPVAVTCLVVCMMCHMCIHTGWMVNHIDLSPNFSGTLMALGNTLTNIVVMVMPVLVSNIVIDIRDVHQWRIMLFLVAGIAFIPNLIFVTFMSADVQPWNEGYISETEINGVKMEIVEKKGNKK